MLALMQHHRKATANVEYLDFGIACVKGKRKFNYVSNPER